MSTDTHIPPQALEAEKAVLGAVLLDNKSIHDLPAKLKSEAFYMPTHGHIFEAMLALWQREAPIDVVSLADQLKKAGNDIAASDMLELPDFGMPRSIGHHANLVIESWRQRRTIEVVRDNLRELQESPTRVDEIVSQLSLALADDLSAKDTSYSISDVMVAAIKRIEQSGGAL